MKNGSQNDPYGPSKRRGYSSRNVPKSQEGQNRLQSGTATPERYRWVQTEVGRSHTRRTGNTPEILQSQQLQQNAGSQQRMAIWWRRWQLGQPSLHTHRSVNHGTPTHGKEEDRFTGIFVDLEPSRRYVITCRNSSTVSPRAARVLQTDSVE